MFEVETGKAVVELPTPHAGKITKIHVEKGSKVKVGDALLTIETGAAAAAAAKKQPPATAAAKPSRQRPKPAAAASKPAPKSRPPAAGRTTKMAAAPAAPAAPARLPRPATSGPRQQAAAGRAATRRLARELGVDLARSTAPAPPDASPKTTSRPRSAADRRPIARLGRRSRGPLGSAAGRHRRSRRLGPDPPHEDGRRSARRSRSTWLKSATTIPHVTNFDDADITELERIRKGGLADYVDSSIKLTMMPFVMKAIAQSLGCIR